jgi:hypothetical protein
MGPKKKGKDEEEDTSTKDLLTYYKKNCKEYEISVCKILEGKILEVLDEDTHLPEILVNEKLGEFGARALSNALIRTKYILFLIYLVKVKAISTFNPFEFGMEKFTMKECVLFNNI